MPDGRTTQPHVERFEGMRTPLHQRRRQQNIFPAEPTQYEFPEVDTARYRQQWMDDRSNPSPQIEVQESGKCG